MRAQAIQNQNTSKEGEKGGLTQTTNSYYTNTDNSIDKQHTIDQTHSNGHLSKVASFVSSHDSYFDESGNNNGSIQNMKEEEDDDPNQIFRFQEDPSMAYQVALHDDIISKHSVRQQRMGLDGIDNDNRYLPSVDYVCVCVIFHVEFILCEGINRL